MFGLRREGPELALRLLRLIHDRRSYIERRRGAWATEVMRLLEPTEAQHSRLEGNSQRALLAALLIAEGWPIGELQCPFSDILIASNLLSRVDREEFVQLLEQEFGAARNAERPVKRCHD